MKFTLRPIISEMKEFYAKPISQERFQEYLSKLNGNTKSDLALPIGGFNPMAKSHVLDKLSELEELEAEKLMKDALEELNASVRQNDDEEITVVLNLADDLKGGWTNRYVTDFDSKFKINALVTRKFCTPYFWTSESYTEESIKSRTIEYCKRTLFWLDHGRLKTLNDHLEQERFVFKGISEVINQNGFEFIQKFFHENRASEDYHVLFNFFYGDDASNSLQYPALGINEVTGFDYAKYLD